MTDLIKQVGGIDSAKEIVSGAPIECAYYGLVNNIAIYYQWSECWFWHNPNTNEYEQDFSKSMRFSLNDLRQAIADYNTDHCSDIINHVSPSTQVYDK